MEQFMTPEFWVAVGQIIMIDILLGGDNAVVIALACRKLPPAQRTKGIIWGTAGAIVLRVILIFFALTLLAQGALATWTSVADADAAIREESTRWKKLIKEARIQAE